LAIAKHLVQGMHGEIGVESGAGGTCFTVRLPGAGPVRG
jgi:two-component system phosphate regulon sensor histidine kinase PhoR